MRFLILITTISAFLLLWNRSHGLSLTAKKAKEAPSFMKGLHMDFKETFKRPEDANVLWGLMTGEKKGITSKTTDDFKSLQLGFLFSPSGIHLSSLILALFFLIKKILSKRHFKFLYFSALTFAFFLPYLAIKRIVCFRLLLMLRSKFKLKASIEVIFLLTFVVSFLLGHFKESPLGFIYSFLFMGTFISLRDYSRIKVLIGLLAAHLLIDLFNGETVSPLSLIINIPFLGFFSFLMPLSYLYLGSFKWISFNWIEPLTRFFIVGVHFCAKLLQGSSWDPSLTLILFLWLILFGGKKRFLTIVLILHTTMANSPAIFLGS